MPLLGRYPGGGSGNPLQYSCQGNPMDREAWQATVHGGHKESGVTEHSTHSSNKILCKQQFYENKAGLGALLALEREVQSFYSLDPILYPSLEEECETSHGLKTTRPVDFFFFWIPLFFNILNLRNRLYNTKGRINLFPKLVSLQILQDMFNCISLQTRINYHRPVLRTSCWSLNSLQTKRIILDVAE